MRVPPFRGGKVEANTESEGTKEDGADATMSSGEAKEVRRLKQWNESVQEFAYPSGITQGRRDRLWTFCEQLAGGALMVVVRAEHPAGLLRVPAERWRATAIDRLAWGCARWSKLTKPSYA